MKKIIKKSIPPILVIFILSVCILAGANAEGNVVLSSTPFLVHQGESFSTTIFIPDNANIISFDVTLNYDSDLLTLTKIEENEDIKGSIVFNAETEGKLIINYTRTSQNVTKMLPLLDVSFDVNDNIGVDSYDCFSVDYESEYVAHTLRDDGIAEVVDFECDFPDLVIYEIGDVDLSKKVDIADATYIRRHLAEFEGAVLSGFRLSLADTYFDEVVDIADAVCLQRYLAKFDVIYGNRVNITFNDINGDKIMTKSVTYNNSLNIIPDLPAIENRQPVGWSLSRTEYQPASFNNLTKSFSVYAVYTDPTDPAMQYYKNYLTDKYYSGDMPTNLNSNISLIEDIYYQKGCHARLIFTSNNNYVLNQTNGIFTKPTYPQDIAMTVKIISYDVDETLVSEDTITFDYDVPGEFVCPTKAEVTDFLNHYLTDPTDDQYRVNFDVKLIRSISNTFIPAEGSLYDNFQIRLDWYQKVINVENGVATEILTPVSEIKRTTTAQENDYVVIASFNGKPLEDDGKIYFDNVQITPIEKNEIKEYIISQIAANQGTLATEGCKLWNNDKAYNTTVTWETGNPDIAYVANNEIQLENDAVSGTTLPLNARVSYAIDGGEADEFVLAYNLTVSCNNTLIKAPENMDPLLYDAIKNELSETLGYRGDLTSAALKDVRFVNLDLSGYPEISSLRGLSYCEHLRTLNISGIKILDGTMNQIATLSYLEAFIARGCELDNLADGGTPTLKNAVNLKLLDLTDNNFTSLNSVFDENVRYGKLREVYLSDNKLTDINALSRAPMMSYLSLSGNGLTTEGTASIANFTHLTYLSLAHNNIDSVEHLKDLKYLTELRLHHNNISNVRDLRRLVNLEILYLGHNNIQDVGFLNTLAALKIFYINHNDIRDISNLNALTKLELFNANNNKITSMNVLNNYKSTLTEIYAENNLLTDFSFINGATNLRILMLGGNETEIAQDNMTAWLSALPEMQILTLSGIKLNDLAFLDSMTKLVRLDVASCSLTAFSGESSNIQYIADRNATLKILNISDNDFNSEHNEIEKLRNLNNLTVLYADNVCDNMNAYQLTYSIPELRFISLENCGITDISWLYKYPKLVFVDLAGNDISDVNFDAHISNASIKTLDELYLDTNVPCAFTNAYRTDEFNVRKLSLSGVNVAKMEYLPYLDNIKYLNLSNSGLTNLTGDDLELKDMYSLERYETLETVDFSHTDTDISIVENMPSVETVYAIGTTDSQRFYKTNLHTLQRLYNKGITCYLYDDETVYQPTATKEGVDILALIEDFSCDVTVAADNVISDNNPFIIDEINDFDITWTVSNSENYEIKDNHLSVKDYSGIEDETLTITASIIVYPDQPAVTRDFTINTSILRANINYFEIDATDYSEQLTRDSVFDYNLTLKPAETEGFANPVKPVEDNITYTYSVVTEAGTSIPYQNALIVNENNNFAVASNAPLNSTITISIDITHTSKTGVVIPDVEQITVPINVVSRTFNVTFVMNGGTIKDSNGVSRETVALVEDSLIFENLTYSRLGYEFKGWYIDEQMTQLFSVDGIDATMPSEDITLYAKWNALSYDVFFNANGGSVTPASKTAFSDVALGELPVPTRQYHTFNGWFTAETGGTQVTADSKFARTENITLYAHWTLNSFIVTFDANGGTVGEGSRRAYCGTAIGSLPTPSRNYHIFKGWTTAKTGGNAITSSTTWTTANDITVYAQWELKPIKGWIKASELPSGAQVVERKYTYTKRSYTESSSSSMNGWTKYDTQRTSWTAWSSWSTTNPANGVRDVESRSVYDHTEYHYYRWRNSSKTAIFSYKNPEYGCTILEEKWFNYKLPTSSYGDPDIKYNGTDNWANRWIPANYAGNYSTDKTFTRKINRTEWRYRDPVYTYYYYQDNNLESSSYPSGDHVSNIVEWVKYREK